MKILHIIDSEGLYGAETMLLNLAEEQVQIGLSPVIMSIGPKNISDKEYHLSKWEAMLEQLLI